MYLKQLNLLNSDVFFGLSSLCLWNDLSVAPALTNFALVHRDPFPRAVLVTTALQHPLWSPAGTCCVSLTAFSQQWPPEELTSIGQPGEGPSTHHPVEGSVEPLLHQVEPWRSWIPFHSAYEQRSLNVRISHHVRMLLHQYMSNKVVMVTSRL